ncbi:hypothetical protein [Candidatus Deianiraea vastatrix]|uniref:Uncharacterized protein n=1 Tax=Candidatus Deianiraea vastatrix TaxID=2163644 RepID=A0A5B8XE66_9RICK|nr:hypothetical protein [Candidatus Deianiraea vastatrix]QED23639.1 hypothetical protein Deia_00852 [Candidatus Deianiraea vastatrix]
MKKIITLLLLASCQGPYLPMSGFMNKPIGKGNMMPPTDLRITNLLPFRQEPFKPIDQSMRSATTVSSLKTVDSFDILVYKYYLPHDDKWNSIHAAQIQANVFSTPGMPKATDNQLPEIFD